MDREERYKKEIEYLRNEIKRLKGELPNLPNPIRIVRRGEGLLSKGRVEYFIRCEKCNFNNARARVRTLDTICPNCGWNRKLSKKEQKEVCSKN